MAVTCLLMGAATAAEAHDILVGTTPKDGSTAAVVPAQVTLTFNEPAIAVGTIVVVTGPAGNQVQSGATVLIGNTVNQHLRPGSPAGRYTVAWRVTSADGHPASGSFSFTALAASPGQQAASTTSTTPSKAGDTSTNSSSGTSGTNSTSRTASAGPGGSLSALWWIGVAGAVVLLLLTGFIVARRPRLSSGEERDRQS